MIRRDRTHWRTSPDSLLSSSWRCFDEAGASVSFYAMTMIAGSLQYEIEGYMNHREPHDFWCI